MRCYILHLIMHLKKEGGQQENKPPFNEKGTTLTHLA